MLGISFTEGRARGLRTPSPQLLLREENSRQQPCRPVSTPPVISHQNNNYSEAHTQYIHVHVNADGHLDRQQIQKTVSSKGNKMMCFNTCVSWLIELCLSSLTCHKPPIASTIDLTIMKLILWAPAANLPFLDLHRVIYQSFLCDFFEFHNLQNGISEIVTQCLPEDDEMSYKSVLLEDFL